MKVLDLRCGNQHRFEGWFGSEDDFQSQTARQLVVCPVCNSPEVVRLPSAPRLGRGRAADTAAAAPAPDAVRDADLAHQRVQGRWLQALRKVLNDSEDVGPRFAEEARRIHHGEAEGRSIRGQASNEEAAALRDEGIEVVAVALPELLKGPVH